MDRVRTLRIGPPVRGLSDFPEHASPEHSTQALNVEFRYGGVSTRRGTVRKANSIYLDSGGTARAVTVKLVKPVGLLRGSEMVAIGLVPTAGVEDNEERLLIRWLVDGSANGNPAGSLQLQAPHAEVNVSPTSRWDATQFHQMHKAEPDLVVCTDHATDANGHTHVVNFVNALSSSRLVGINRTASAYHGTVVPGSPYADDPGTYVTSGISARYCRAHRGRLVLGNIRNVKAMGIAPGRAMEAAIWVSNFADAFGFATEYIYLPRHSNVGAVTGLASWQDNIVVFRRGSVALFQLQMQSAASGVLREVVHDRGCVAHSTIIDDVEGMCVFLAGDGLYGFNGSPSPVYLSGGIERTLRQSLEGEFLGAAWAMHYAFARQVWLGVPSGANTPDRVFIMDYGQSPPAWSVFEFENLAWQDGQNRHRIGGMVVSPKYSDIYGVQHRVVGAGVVGTVDYNQYDVGDAIDNQGSALPTGFRSQWESGPVNFGKNDVDRWRYVRHTIRPTNTDTTAWWRRGGQRFDNGALNGQSTTLSTAAQGGGNGLGVFVLGTDFLGAAADHQVRLDVHTGGTGYSGHIGVRTTAGTSHKFFIQGVEIDTLDKGVRR